MYKLDVPLKSEYPVLLQVWESSVKATHHFLHKDDFKFFKGLIEEKNIFDHLDLTVARNNNNTIAGMMGITGNVLDMLFVDAAFIGKGVGKQLMLHAINHFKVIKVDVNEQNENAVKFYEHFGFKTISRSALDDLGKPYPHLHMERR